MRDDKRRSEHGHNRILSPLHATPLSPQAARYRSPGLALFSVLRIFSPASHPKAWGHGVATVLLRYCYGIAPMWVAQLTDFEQDTEAIRHGSFFHQPPLRNAQPNVPQYVPKNGCFWTGPESEIRIARIDTKWAALGGDEVVWRLGGAFGGSTRSLLFGLTAPGVKAPGSPASQG